MDHVKITIVMDAGHIETWHSVSRITKNSKPAQIVDILQSDTNGFFSDIMGKVYENNWSFSVSTFNNKKVTRGTSAGIPAINNKEANYLKVLRDYISTALDIRFRRNGFEKVGEDRGESGESEEERIELLRLLRKRSIELADLKEYKTSLPEGRRRNEA